MKRDVAKKFFIIVGISVFFIASIFFLDDGVRLTGDAIFEDSVEDDFLGGTYNNTYWNGSAVVLAAENLTGSYISQIFDAGNDAVWNNISFESNTPNVEVLYSVDGGGDVYKSLDLGENWSLSQEDFGRTTATEYLFSNNNYLYILSSSGNEVWKSSDGVGFSVVYDEFGNSPLVGDSDDNGNLYVAVAPGEVWKSEDNGSTWTLKGDFNPGTQNPKGISIDSNGYVYAVDGTGSVYKSINDGVDWTNVNEGYGGSTGTDGMEEDSNDNLYILINYDLYKSNDSGVTWEIINDSITSYANVLVKILIDDNDVFYILDAVGRVFKSVDFGINWIEVGDCNNDASNDPAGITDLFQTTSLDIQVKSCNDSECSGEMWTDINDASLQDLSLTNNQYFQYKISFVSPDSSITSSLGGVNINYDLLESNSPNIIFSSSTTEEGDYSNKENIRINVELSDESQIYSFINFNNSLIGFWKMNESSVNILDYSGYGNDGINNGAISISGKFGKALEFNGDDDYVEFSRDDFDFPVAPFTISFWAKEKAEALDNQIILGTYYSKEIIISGKIGGTLRFWAGGYNAQVSSNKNVNEWHHIVFSIDSFGNREVYIDNSKSSWATKPLPIAGSQNFQIGSGGGYNYYFNGSLDDVLIFNRILSTEEVSALYSASSYSENFTELEQGNYNFYAYAQDTQGSENQTETRIVTLSENAPPTLNLNSPQDGASYGYNESLALDFFVSDDDDNLNSCWYNLNNQENISLIDCVNISIDVPEGENTLIIYANDSEGEEGSDLATFNVAVGAPSIVLSSPIDAYFSSGENVQFNYVPTDLDLESCWLLGDFEGDFKRNQTDNAPTSGEVNSFELDLVDGVYLWNVGCNDSQNNSAVNGNKTFYVDTISPEISISEPTGQKALRTGISLTFTVADDNINSCWYNVYRGDSLEIANTSVNCSGSTTFDLTVDADFVLNLFVNDSAGNFNYTDSSFNVDTSVDPVIPPSEGSPGGGGGGFVVKTEINLEIGELKGVLVPGAEKSLIVSVKNNGNRAVNKCKLKSNVGIESSTIKNIASGEIVEFPFILKMVDVIPELWVECLEGRENVSIDFVLFVSDLNVDIEKIDLGDGEIVVNYLVGVESDFDGLLTFRISDSDGSLIASVDEKVSVVGGDVLSGAVVIDLNSDFNGLLNVGILRGDDVLIEDTIVYGDVVIGTGFAVGGVLSNENLIYGGLLVLVFLIVGFFIVKRIISNLLLKRSRKKIYLKGKKSKK